MSTTEKLSTGETLRKYTVDDLPMGGCARWRDHDAHLAVGDPLCGNERQESPQEPLDAVAPSREMLAAAERAFDAGCVLGADQPLITRRDYTARLNTYLASLCDRHGGPWGDDETCPRCTLDGGTPRRRDEPGPLTNTQMTP